MQRHIVSARYLNVNPSKKRGKRTDLEIVYSSQGKTIERTWQEGETVDPSKF